MHNGDFANYHSVSEYLKQRNIYPQFLTDTEVSVLLFDLLQPDFTAIPWSTSSRPWPRPPNMDFDQLPAEKQQIYRHIQATHIHGSPDGPWFFIIARNDPVPENTSSSSASPIRPCCGPRSLPCRTARSRSA